MGPRVADRGDWDCSYSSPCSLLIPDPDLLSENFAGARRLSPQEDRPRLVDIHTHVLYGLDDGAATRADSVAMLRAAARHGTRLMVATPHANHRYRFDPELVRARVAELQELVPEVELRSGCDFHLSFENVRDLLEHPARYSIHGGPYLLVELADSVVSPAISEVLGLLVREGLCPVITHPERNAWLRERTETLAAWVRAGCLIQITAQSVAGGFGRRARAAAEALLSRRLVHAVASDCHDCEGRPPNLREARDLVCAAEGARVAEQLFEGNPEAIASGFALEHRGASGPKRFSLSSLFH